MQAALAALTGVPAPAQRLLLGFPPRSLDLSDGDRRLGDLGIHSGEGRAGALGLRGGGWHRSGFTRVPGVQRQKRGAGRSRDTPGDTLIVEEDTSKPKTDSPVVAKRTMSNSVREAVPVLARRVVPADNSCLFTSVYYVVEGGVYDPGCAPEMRSLIAQIVASDPESYCEAVLGKTNREYCDWIRREETWGGAIEVSILSKFYQCEICVVDTQTVRIDRFGEDAGYTKRVLLIYDGIHYDPLERKIPDSDIPPQTIFSTTDDIVLAQALELADEARRKRQFTDVNRFTLRCMVCQKGLTGQVEAREHAKETGHTNFGEV
ncbi:ubiquitin thioesterase OTU1 [Strix aluco]|uniref:ubiquitin thioesterase OTU1 n=1 Tax=Strix aluco TaxID=111821 RepID=UPI003DA5F662